MRPVKKPNGSSSWHPRAKEWFTALRNSGQSDYFQDSDWAMAKMCADMITHIYENKFYRMAMMISEVNSMMARLGTSEGDRRQTMRVELDLPIEEQVSEMDQAKDFYRQQLEKISK